MKLFLYWAVVLLAIGSIVGPTSGAILKLTDGPWWVFWTLCGVQVFAMLGIAGALQPEVGVGGGMTRRALAMLGVAVLRMYIALPAAIRFGGVDGTPLQLAVLVAGLAALLAVPWWIEERRRQHGSG